jgi:hypothetical protein
MARLSRDSFEYEKRGRVVGEDDYRAVIRARARELLRGGGGARSGGRGGSAGSVSPAAEKAVAGIKAGGPSNESVLKVVNWTKARRSALAQALYAARTRDEDPPEHALPMLNESGKELVGAEIEAEVRSWNLKPDRKNLSAAARATFPRERAAMPVNERLHKRQAAHLIFSVPSHTPVDAQRLQQAVSLALRDTLGEAGFRYVSTIHTDHSNRPHAHIVVKATSEPMMIDGREKTTQLRLGPRELEAMRHVFTRHAQEQGIAVVATRREDREHLRDNILAGRAPLRENDRSSAVWKTRQSRAFERAAPQWYAEYGAAYERRRLAAASREPSAASSSMTVGASQKQPGFLGRVLASLRGRQQQQDASRVSTGPKGSVAPSRGDTENSGRGRKPTPQTPAAAIPETQSRRPLKLRGYFANFDQGRAAVDRSDLPTRAFAAAASKIDAYFAATHRDPEEAAASFRAMLREKPKMALWAAHNHRIAFGEPTDAIVPNIQWRDVGELLRGAPQDRPATPPRALDPVLAGERKRIREQMMRARAEQARKRAPVAVARSLTTVAERLELATSNDVDLAKHAAHIREVARGLRTSEAPTRDQSQDQGSRIEPTKRDTSAPYRELEDQLRRRDKARGRQRARDRDEDRDR